jgi:hypothetical protein
LSTCFHKSRILKHHLHLISHESEDQVKESPILSSHSDTHKKTTKIYMIRLKMKKSLTLSSKSHVPI